MAALSDEDYRHYLLSLALFHQAAAEVTGLAGTDYQASNLLDLEGPLTNGELADRLGLTAGATTRLVDRLVALGIVERTRDPHDRRRAVVAHTGHQPDGLDQILADVREPIAQSLAALTPDQLEGVRRYIAAATRAYTDASRALQLRVD